MAEAKLSKNMARLAEAIRANPKTRCALCGFDLWLEVLGSPHVTGRDMTWKGRFVTPEDSPEVLKLPVPVLGKRVVVSFDPTLPPDDFELRA
jgi:hypothetical protein